MYKTRQGRTTFGSWDVEKADAVVARSTFASEHVKNTRVFGPLFDDSMAIDVEKVHTVAARSTFASQESRV